MPSLASPAPLVARAAAPHALHAAHEIGGRSTSPLTRIIRERHRNPPPPDPLPTGRGNSFEPLAPPSAPKGGERDRARGSLRRGSRVREEFGLSPLIRNYGDVSRITVRPETCRRATRRSWFVVRQVSPPHHERGEYVTVVANQGVRDLTSHRRAPSRAASHPGRGSPCPSASLAAGFGLCALTVKHLPVFAPTPAPARPMAPPPAGDRGPPVILPRSLPPLAGAKRGDARCPRPSIL